MVCSVKQAATGEYPVGRGPSSRRPTTKEARLVSDDKAKLTEHFIVTLPQLLAKVSTIFFCCISIIYGVYQYTRNIHCVKTLQQQQCISRWFLCDS